MIINRAFGEYLTLSSVEVSRSGERETRTVSVLSAAPAPEPSCPYTLSLTRTTPPNILTAGLVKEMPLTRTQKTGIRVYVVLLSNLAAKKTYQKARLNSRSIFSSSQIIPHIYRPSFTNKKIT